MEVPVNQTITYTFEVSSIVCKYWLRGRWSPVGCDVSTDSKDKDVHCQCTHMSIFGAAFPVPPHEIDPFADAKLFLTALDNPLVVALVMALILLYLVSCVFLWRIDKYDKKQRSVIILNDNFPGSRYPYLIAVYTGSRFNAGTTAHVALRITGSNTSSRVHVLNSNVRTVLRRNSDDWFLMFCESQLGTLKAMHIWHDNYGSSPEWYCDKIHVYDLKYGVKTVFAVEQWLALSPKDYLEEILAPITKKELTDSTEPQTRPQTDNRVKNDSRSKMARVCNLESNVDHHQYEFGTRELYVSIQSLIIGSVVVVLLTFCFRRSYVDTRVTRKGLLYLRDDSTDEINESEGHSSPEAQRLKYPKDHNPPRPSDKESTLNEDKSKGKSIYGTFIRIVIKAISSPPLPPIQLPSTVIMVRVRKIWLVTAWSLCIIITAVTAYLVMLYGLKLGPVKSKEWLSTVLAAIGGETFISDPAKIIFFSIILTMAFQRKYEVDTHGVEYLQAIRFKVRSDRKYIEDLLQRRRHPMYAPILPEIRQEMLRKQNTRRNWLYFIDFIASALFVVVISIIINRLWSSHYYTNNQVKKLITASHQPDVGVIDFYNIRDTSESIVLDGRLCQKNAGASQVEATSHKNE
ncbi:hypothetical protein J6590_041429 [Homalodisca vitripennis]|nr:hypothetical protein J6590_041429 [Homalodisca vitripennis]